MEASEFLQSTSGVQIGVPQEMSKCTDEKLTKKRDFSCSATIQSKRQFQTSISFNKNTGHGRGQ